MLNQHLFKVTSDVFPKWYYYLWIKYHLPDFQTIAAGKATTMGHIQRHHLNDSHVLVPPSSMLASMDRIVSPLLAAVTHNSTQQRIMAAIRDALLPKLLSGELRVLEAEKYVEAVV